MITLLCGQGAGASGVLAYLRQRNHRVQVFTHEGSDLAREPLATTRSVNDLSAWQFAPGLPGLLVSVGYREIVSRETLNILNGRAVNCHYSLLPRHRGRSSVPWAIVDGDDVTGVSWHWMVPHVDAGRLILQASVEIDPMETQASLFKKLHEVVIETAPAALALALVDYPGFAQRGRASRHKAGPPYGGRINPMWDDDRIDSLIRAMTFPPLPYATYRGREVETIEDFYHLIDQDHGAYYCDP